MIEKEGVFCIIDMLNFVITDMISLHGEHLDNQLSLPDENPSLNIQCDIYVWRSLLRKWVKNISTSLQPQINTIMPSQRNAFMMHTVFLICMFGKSHWTCSCKIDYRRQFWPLMKSLTYITSISYLHPAKLVDMLN